MITLSEVKYRSEKIHFFGLGFIQIKLDKPGVRIHVYTPELPSIMPKEEVHNHRANFKSIVIAGHLTQQIFRLKKGLGLLCKHVSCDITKPSKDDGFETQAEMLYASTITAGSQYYLNNGTFHRVLESEGITLIEKDGPNVKEYASVLRPIGAPEVCPFSKQIKDSELWEVVEKQWEKFGLAK